MKAADLVAWYLRRLRVRRGLSQEGLAADANVDRSYLGSFGARPSESYSWCSGAHRVRAEH